MVNAGVTLPIEPRDLFGNSRPASGAFDIGANEFKDTDGDGMQDDWETKNGLNAGSSSDATGNPDGDGSNNQAEYQRNSNPQSSDSDGDGIADQFDSDPTKPELVLNTIFWDYFYESVFSMYFDGVLDPRWINNPPLAPRPVVLTDRHIGDHIFMQWHVESFGFDPAFLVFYVPHTTRGCIIPDVNAVPLNEIQFGFGDWAPPGGPWGFTIAETTPTNDICSGFDDETPKFFPWLSPALSVPLGGTNTLGVVIRPTNVINQILFRMTNAVTASVSPSSASSATQWVSVASLTNGSAMSTNQLQVLGYGAQNTFTTVCSRVTVDILPKRTNVTVATYAVTAQGEPSTAPTNAPTQASLSNYLNQVYGKQANVYMTVLPLTNIVVNYDVMITNGVLDIYTNDATHLTVEQAAITNAAYRSGAINVYFVKALSSYAGISYPPPLRAVFIQDSHEDSPAHITAHEIGHQFGLVNVDYYKVWGYADRLMWGVTQFTDPCRLVWVEWRGVNLALQP